MPIRRMVFMPASMRRSTNNSPSASKNERRIRESERSLPKKDQKPFQTILILPFFAVWEEREMGRNKTQSLEEMTRACLEGKVAPEVLHAPKTGGDPRSNGKFPDIYSRSIGYIMRNVVGKPWADHLVLVTGVLSAQRYDPSTVKNCLYSVNARLTDFFQEKQVRSLDEWDAEECMIAYLKGELLPKDTQGVRDRFCSYYLTCVKQVNAWLHTLPPVEKALYQRFLLPPIHPLSVEGLTKRRQVIQQS